MERLMQNGMKSREVMMARENMNGEQFAQGLHNVMNS